MLRRADAAGRLLLERMHNPEVAPDLNSIDNPVGVAAKRQGNLKNTGPQPKHRLGNISLLAGGRYFKRSGASQLRIDREAPEVLRRCFDP